MTATRQRMRRPWLVAAIVSLAGALGACGAVAGDRAGPALAAPEGEPRASGRVPDPEPACTAITTDARPAQAMRRHAAGRSRSSRVP